MITSYLTPQNSLLYLSLVGPLDRAAADDLVAEYYERHDPRIRETILDLTAAEEATEPGLNVLHRLSLLTQVDGAEFSVVSRGSAAHEQIAESARHYWVPLVDSVGLPFASTPAF